MTQNIKEEYEALLGEHFSKVLTEWRSVFENMTGITVASTTIVPVDNEAFYLAPEELHREEKRHIAVYNVINGEERSLELLSIDDISIIVTFCLLTGPHNNVLLAAHGKKLFDSEAAQNAIKTFLGCSYYENIQDYTRDRHLW